MSEIIGKALLVIGLVFNIIGCIGLIRFPDIYNRLQATTKCITMGTCSVLVGTMILSGQSGIVTRCILCMVFILITSPTAAHALARASHAFGVKLWDKSVVDKYTEDRHPGIEIKDEK